MREMFGRFFGNRDNTPKPETEFTVAISAEDWKNGKRPEGYVPITEVVTEARKKGVDIPDVLSKYEMTSWNELMWKAKNSGLTRSEANEIANLSDHIVHGIELKMGGN